ncbi:MAG: hypothetical protein U0487_02775 [Patescibacteria group bacterium]
MNKNTLKSIWAVFAGFLTVVILSVATDAVLESVGVFPPPTGGLFVTWMLVVALLYRSAYTVIGGFVTAWLAPGNAKKLVMILGILGTIAGTAGVIIGWNLSAHWYPIALAVTAYPLTWLGGKLKTK